MYDYGLMQQCQLMFIMMFVQSDASSYIYEYENNNIDRVLRGIS